MKRYIQYSLFLLSVLIMNLRILSQDVQFSQFYTAKFNIAPSFAGTAENGRLTVLSRDQWPLLKNTFLTVGFGIDYYLPSINGGIGVFALQDYSNGGGYVITNTGVQYSYDIELNERWQFRPGLQLSCTNKYIDLNKITFGSQLSFDGVNSDYPANIESDNFTNFETAASVLFFSDIVWIGMNADHIPLTRNTFTGVRGVFPVKYTSFGGILLKKIQGRLLYDRNYIYFSYLFKYQNKSKQIDLGCYWSRKGLELGVWYRGLPFIKNTYGKFNNSALVFKGGYEFNSYIFGYSYDLSLVKAGLIAGGAHEVSMVYFFDLTNELKKKKHKMVPGPRL
jgi:type IX secretion system PorP/SprF family membrane protein